VEFLDLTWSQWTHSKSPCRQGNCIRGKSHHLTVPLQLNEIWWGHHCCSYCWGIYRVRGHWLCQCRYKIRWLWTNVINITFIIYNWAWLMTSRTVFRKKIQLLKFNFQQEFQRDYKQALKLLMSWHRFGSWAIAVAFINRNNTFLLHPCGAMSQSWNGHLYSSSGRQYFSCHATVTCWEVLTQFILTQFLPVSTMYLTHPMPWFWPGTRIFAAAMEKSSIKAIWQHHVPVYQLGMACFMNDCKVYISICYLL